MHLIIDGYSSEPQIMQDEEFLYQLLDSYPSKIGMTKISPPFVSKYIGSRPEDWGISGFVLIAESHISVHTFVERGYVNIDVFSCRDFDAQQVIDDLKEKFRLKKFKTYLIDREWLASCPVSYSEVVELHSDER